MEVTHFTHSPSRPLAFFAGSWTDNEMAVLERTLLAVEERMDLPSVAAASLWTCNHATVPRDVYILTRYCMDGVITARSVAELRLKLLRMVDAITVF